MVGECRQYLLCWALYGFGSSPVLFVLAGYKKLYLVKRVQRIEGLKLQREETLQEEQKLFMTEA